MALKFYTSVTKELKLKAKIIQRLITKSVEVTEEKLVGLLNSTIGPHHQPLGVEVCLITGGWKIPEDAQKVKKLYVKVTKYPKHLTLGNFS